jgi:hypothetical protein
MGWVEANLGRCDLYPATRTTKITSVTSPMPLGTHSSGFIYQRQVAFAREGDKVRGGWAIERGRRLKSPRRVKVASHLNPASFEFACLPTQLGSFNYARMSLSSSSHSSAQSDLHGFGGGYILLSAHQRFRWIPTRRFLYGYVPAFLAKEKEKIYLTTVAMQTT